MGGNPAASGPGLRDAGVRSLDHLEADSSRNPEPVSWVSRVRNYVPGSQVRDSHPSFVAWFTVALASAAGGAAVTLAIAGGGT